MNINKIYLLSIVILLISILLLIFFQIKDTSNSEHNKQNYDLYPFTDKNNEIYLVLLNQINNSHIITNNFDLNRDRILLLLPNKNNMVVIYRYAEHMCSSCIQEDLNLVDQFQKEYKDIDVFVAVDYTDNRENYIRFKYELEKFKYFRLDRKLLSLPINSV